MLVVEKEHHIKLFIECLNQKSHEETLQFLKKSFPGANIYDEISDEEYSNEMVVAESHGAYTTMNPQKMLKALRNDQGLTQEALAKQIGTSKTSLSAMENGTRPISESMAHRLAKVLVTHPKVFLEETYPTFRELIG